MTQKDIEILHERLRAQNDQLNVIEKLARETNGRIRELELWRARMQGVASTSKIFWLITGSIVTAIIIQMIHEWPWGQ